MTEEYFENNFESKYFRKIKNVNTEKISNEESILPLDVLYTSCLPSFMEMFLNNGEILEAYAVCSDEDWKEKKPYYNIFIKDYSSSLSFFEWKDFSGTLPEIHKKLCDINSTCHSTLKDWNSIIYIISKTDYYFWYYVYDRTDAWACRIGRLSLNINKQRLIKDFRQYIETMEGWHFTCIPNNYFSKERWIVP